MNYGTDKGSHLVCKDVDMINCSWYEIACRTILFKGRYELLCVEKKDNLGIPPSLAP